jgi:hypothetical protein
MNTDRRSVESYEMRHDDRNKRANTTRLIPGRSTGTCTTETETALPVWSRTTG